MNKLYPRATVVASLLAFALAGTSLAAPTASQKCASKKVKAAGAAVYAESKCEQKALAAGTNVDAACIAGAEDKLGSAFTKAEGAGGCDVTGDGDAAKTDVDQCITSLVSAISGDAKCAAAKMKASGKKASTKAKCQQKAELSGGFAESDCLGKAESKFSSAIAKANGVGTCTDTAANLETLVDACLSDLIGLDGDTCELNDFTSASATVNGDGCAVLERDTDACTAGRIADGLSGYWLKFSCRVTLANGATEVTAEADGQPDYFSNYFDAADPCHETFTDNIQNPNEIAQKNYTIGFPLSPNTTTTAMAGPGTGVVGLSINGVPIFGNFAAPGDNIFEESATFDRCGAHPTQTGQYHYHSEPYSISYDDSSFVGVMRDGYPVYGRRDPDNSLPSLDAQGGHTGVTVDSPVTPVYHYHVNGQVNPDPPNDTQYFLTKGQYHGSPGATCTGC